MIDTESPLTWAYNVMGYLLPITKTIWRGKVGTRDFGASNLSVPITSLLFTNTCCIFGSKYLKRERLTWIFVWIRGSQSCNGTKNCTRDSWKVDWFHVFFKWESKPHKDSYTNTEGAVSLLADTIPTILSSIVNACYVPAACLFLHMCFPSSQSSEIKYIGGSGREWLCCLALPLGVRCVYFVCVVAVGLVLVSV